MPKLKINGQEIEVEPGTSILQACEQLGEEIPRFCYHDRLSVPANCRMCLVEVKGAPKPVASCAMPCGDDMEVFTQSELTKKARSGVMEFLLINHPLDCPICDQGGECDLQDQSMGYGMDHSRYEEAKRAVKDKELGPLIKTVMTRCIHCTRCVRFSDEIAGVPELGAVYRGEHMEIGTYVEHMVTTELSGNLIDVCPVGALTSKPYAFHARPWELRKTETVDVLDAVGSNIRVDSRGGEVMRVLPRLHEDVNEEWINDRTRFSYDGLKRQRLDRPFVRDENGRLRPASWEDAFVAIAEKLGKVKGDEVAAIAGDLCDSESVFALKSLMDQLGSPHMDCRQDGAQFDTSVPAGYRFNSTIAGIEQADAILIVGTNPRWEATMINARIRKRFLVGGLKVGYIGPQGLDLTYPYDYIGAGPKSMKDLAEGKGDFSKILKKAERPMIILGAGALRRDDGMAIHNLAHQLVEKYDMVRTGDEPWNGFNLLHTAAARVGALELGFTPGKGGKDTNDIIAGTKRGGGIKALYLLGADEIDPEAIGKDCFVVYQGHHGDAGAMRADVILPGAAYTEKHGIYVNTEGRAQIARPAVHPLGDAREDWKIIRALSGVIDKELPFNTLAELREGMRKTSQTFERGDEIPSVAWKPFGKKGKVTDTPFALPVDNFYMTDPVTRASETMAKCTQAFLKAEAARGTDKRREKTGTNG